jgi:hypothetical protein
VVRALGGPVAKDSSYVTGERGPELFVSAATDRQISSQIMQQLERVSAATNTTREIQKQSAVGAAPFTDSSVTQAFTDNSTSAVISQAAGDIAKTLQTSSSAEQMTVNYFMGAAASDGVANHFAGAQSSVTNDLASAHNAFASTVVLPPAEETLPPIAGARADGGPVASGMPYLVGENGPEIFVPSDHGDIVPAEKATPSAGGQPTRVVINNYTSAQPVVTESQQGNEKVLEIAIRRTKNELAAEIRDGRGSVNKALQGAYSLQRGRS